MILYEVFPNKKLKILEDENTYITENLISSVHIKLPSTFGDYPVKELTAELRFYFPEGDYMAYSVDTQQARPEVPITNDITEKPQTLSVMLFFYKGGNVIGKTNTVNKVILDSHLKGEPLTPRAEFDEVIAEQRERIAEQAETITEQAETISSQGEQITELSGEVTELTSENTRLEELTDTQNDTIQYMIDHQPEPKLYTPPVVTPSGSVQQINPPTGYDGLSGVTVAPVIIPEIRLQNKLVDPTSNTQLIEADEGYDGLASVSVTGTSYMNIDLQKWVNHSPDDEPFEMIFEKAVQSYIAYGQIKMIKATILTATSIGGSAFQGCTALIKVNLPDSLTSIDSSAFYNCTSLTELTLPDSLTSIGQSAFRNCTSLTELTLPDALTSIGGYAFQNCTSLMEVTLPDSLTSIGGYVFQYCNSLQTINLPSSLTSVGSPPFDSCRSLQFVTIENNFNCNNLNLSASTLYSVETIVSWFEALADRTGETAYTLAIGSTNLNKMTTEEKAIAINKNWNLA